MGNQHSVIIVAGPTASGKSDFAEQLARRHNGEIINADSVQMFTRLAVGTAKPDWRASDIPHHLFDICDQPQDFDVATYRDRVTQIVEDICARGKVPILVGGSLFYIKSLFYPPVTTSKKSSSRVAPYADLSDQQAWEKLQSIDAERAAKVHPHDRYRVDRALQLWLEHGVAPSTLQPIFTPLFKAHFFFLAPDRETLYERINLRTEIMIRDQGWIDEARDAYDDEQWRDFILQKKFIGYPELFAWIAAGEPADQRAGVISKIQQETRRYARRQKIFWRKFCEQIRVDSQRFRSCSIDELSSGDLSRVPQFLSK